METALRGSDATGERARRRGPISSSAILLAGVALLALGSLAGECRALEVRAWVDKTEATLEDTIFLTVSVSGQRRLSVDPELPPLPDFHVAEGGTSSQTQIVNGAISTSVERTYLLTPKRTGTFTIGPVRLKTKGRIYQSRPIRVKVLPAASSAEERPMAFVTQHVDVEAPYLHQEVVYTFRFLRRVQSLEAQWDPPSFQGFWVEDLGKERQYEKVIHGQRYAVTELKKVLYPLTEGPVEIEASRLACQLAVRTGRPPSSLDGFFGGSFFGSRAQTVTKNLRTEPLSLRVRPLPEAGRPEGFRGLVGTFSVRAEIGTNHLRVGDSTTLTVTVTGKGNLRDLAAVSPEALPGFKVYPDKPSFELEVQGDELFCTKVFKKALVAVKEGALEIPAQEVAYFDPEAGEYRIARAEPITIRVEAGREKEPLHLVTAAPLPGSKSSIQILGKDILPIHTGLAGARNQLPAGKDLYGILACLFLPPCVFVACYGRKRRKERLETDRHILRRKEARKKARRLLGEAKKEIRRPEDREYFARLARGLKGFIGDKLDRTTLAYTPVEIERCLVEAGLTPKEAGEVRAFLERLEYDQYAATRVEAAEREARHKTAQRLVRRLDRRL